MSSEVQRKAFNDFGSLLIENVRDRTIIDMDKFIDGRSKTSYIGQLIEPVRANLNMDQIDLLRMLVTVAVDTTLHALLFAIEENEWVTVSLATKDVRVSDIRDVVPAGELRGYAFIWPKEFSKQRLFPLPE